MNINYFYISFIVLPLVLLIILYENDTIMLPLKILSSVFNLLKKVFVMFLKLILNITKYTFKIILFVLACLWSIGVFICTFGTKLINPKVTYDTLDIYLEAFFTLIFQSVKYIDIAINYIKQFISYCRVHINYIISLIRKYLNKHEAHKKL